MYQFHGVETDANKRQSRINDGRVNVFAFKSAENGFFFLCARDGKDVALQVAWLVLLASFKLTTVTSVYVARRMACCGLSLLNETQTMSGLR